MKAYLHEGKIILPETGRYASLFFEIMANAPVLTAFKVEKVEELGPAKKQEYGFYFVVLINLPDSWLKNVVDFINSNC